MTRFPQQQIDQMDAEYSEKYPLYNALSVTIERFEGRQGGLRAPEVWHEVLNLEQRLPTAPRPDKFISQEWTRLQREFKWFDVMGPDNKLYSETANERTQDEVERSVVCVMLALGMRLASYEDNKPNPYQGIMDTIHVMAMDCQNKAMVLAILDGYYEGEDKEFALGNRVPEEDVLLPHFRKQDKKQQEFYNNLKRVTDYFSGGLSMANVLHPEWDHSHFYRIWDDLLKNDRILELMAKTTKIQNTLKDDSMGENAKDNFVKTNGYNLHWVLNFIGVLLQQGVLEESISQIRQIFFEDQSKDKYFNPKYFMKFGHADSAFPTEEDYQQVVAIIKKTEKQLKRNRRSYE